MNPPIEMVSQITNDFTRELIKHEEEAIMLAVCEVRISVDKEELIRALQYDRNQSEKSRKRLFFSYRLILRRKDCGTD